MKEDMLQNTDKLAELVKAKSKHSDYQLLHPVLAPIVGGGYKPSGKYEEERQAYMERHVLLNGKTVLDIGANTGYFSFGALQAGAEKVLSIEGNEEHADFISAAAHCLGGDNLEVHHGYFDFNNQSEEYYDVILCLNVLHHLGDDFGDQRLLLDDAKKAMVYSLNALSAKCNLLWMQLGFNWKGDREQPLFSHGTKAELIDFIRTGGSRCWDILDIAVFDPDGGGYASISKINMQRFDHLGEFLNRPLFLMESKQIR